MDVNIKFHGEPIFQIFMPRAVLVLWGPCYFLNIDFFIPNTLIFHCLNIPQNSSNSIVYCLLSRPQFQPLGGAIIKASVFWLISHTYFVAHSKPYIHTFTEFVLNFVIWATPISTCLFFSNLRKVADLLFQTPPRRFHRFPWNFAHRICGPSWQKAVKRILIFETILKLLNNNFQYILLKAQSVAYLHNGLSEWHETQVTTSPWATKALWRNDKLTFSNSS